MSEAPPPAAPRTILVVEDDAAIRGLIQLALKHQGYRVLVAVDGPSALEVAAGHEGAIDLLFTDLMLPGLSGRQVFERLRPARPEMRVLFASGFAGGLHGTPPPDAAFLDKPFTPSILIAKVREVLGA